MIDQTTLITYLLILLGFVFLPGPAVVLTMTRAAASGTKAGLATGLGIACGDLLHTALAVVGLSALVLASAFWFSLIKYLGAAYLVYLGVQALMAKSPPGSTPSTSAVPPRIAFRQAILAELLNPKSALFFLAFLPQFVRPENGPVAIQLTLLGVIFVIMGLLSTVVFAFGAGWIGTFLKRNPKVLRWQNKVVGGIYIALGSRLAFQDR